MEEVKNVAREWKAMDEEDLWPVWNQVTKSRRLAENRSVESNEKSGGKSDKTSPTSTLSWEDVRMTLNKRAIVTLDCDAMKQNQLSRRRLLDHLT